MTHRWRTLGIWATALILTGSAIGSLACAPGSTETSNEASVAPAAALAELAALEVVSLHEFIEQWSRGDLADTDAEYRRFSGALAPDFVLIGTRGERGAEGATAQVFRSAYGRWRGLEPARIEVRDVRTRSLGVDLVLAEYEEWHFVGEQSTARRSSVLMQRDPSAPGGVVWVHLHETWIDQIEDDQ